jgi:hypothetical protein
MTQSPSTGAYGTTAPAQHSSPTSATANDPAPAAVEAVVQRAGELARSGDTDPAVVELTNAAGGDRRAVEGARDRLATRLHVAVDDFEATATLQLLNRTLSRLPRVDPLDWRVRWTQRFRRP